MNLSSSVHLLQVVTASFLLAAEGKTAEILLTPRLRCEVTNTARSTLISAKAAGSNAAVILRLDWFSAKTKPENFLNKPVKDNALVSTHRLGEITVTRTILASPESDTIFLHVHADQPGAVNFTVNFETKEPTEILDRRELVLTGDGIDARTWVIPFESDVENREKSMITLSGEGEALVIFNITSDPQKHPIADTLERIGKKYDPTHTPPSPHLIWEAVKP